jgi:hypothetical protein
MTESIRELFVIKFGEDEAKAIEEAANSHKNGVHDNKGTDPFKWALLICIGYQCMEVESYREHHIIKTEWATLKQWIKNHADLSSHDGDCVFLALFTGAYNEFMKAEGK